jgi:hypothetical protein
MKSFNNYLQERKYADREKEVKLSGGKSNIKINPDSESLKEADIKPPAEKLKTDRNMFSIPADEREAAKQRLLAKAKAKREAMQKEETEKDPFGRPGGKYGGVKKGGGYEKGYLAMQKKLKELEKKEETEMLSFSDFMEARRMDKEGVDRGDSRRAERAEKAKASLAAKAKRDKAIDKYEKSSGRTVDRSKSVEYKAHAKNHPGSRQAPKVKGEKETELQTHNRRVNRSNQRKITHGFTSKEKREAESMAKHTSRFD